MSRETPDIYRDIPKGAERTEGPILEIDGRTVVYAAWVDVPRWGETRFPCRDIYAKCIDVETGEEVRVSYGDFQPAFIAYLQSIDAGDDPVLRTVFTMQGGFG